jgi:hypothetical protein
MLGRRVHVTGPAQARGRAEAGVQRGGFDPYGCGQSYGFVHRLLTEAGTTMRTRGGPDTRRPAGWRQDNQCRSRPRIGWFASRVCPAGSTVHR